MKNASGDFSYQKYNKKTTFTMAYLKISISRPCYRIGKKWQTFIPTDSIITVCKQ